MKTDMVDTKQIELHFEKANMAGEQIEKHVKSAVSIAIVAGAALTAAKDLVPHGEWSVYLKKHWDYSQRLANQYMALSNSQHAANLKDAKSIREALRMIADDKSEIEEPGELAPRSERKTGRVKVAKPTDDSGAEPPNQSGLLRTVDTDDDETVGYYVKKPQEAEKPKTRPVVPEVMREESASVRVAFAVRELSQVLTEIVEASERKKTAKQLRKLADTLDPPTKFVRPDLDEVSAYFSELKAADPESFFDFYESKGWLVGKVSMKDWKASARKWVRENQANGKGTNGHTKQTGNGRGRGLTAEDVFSAESLARGSKQR